MGKCGENEWKDQKQSQNPTKVQRKPIKVKYISSPMMIKASNAHEFRAIVQQLTGFTSHSPTRRSNHKPPPHAAQTPSTSTLHANPQMEALKLSDNMSSLLEFDDEACFVTLDNVLTNNFMGFQASCLFQ
ncbi:hypothetical protein SDJN03_09111, partial [Cucurbita argyrosperma subsp. sororia]